MPGKLEFLTFSRINFLRDLFVATRRNCRGSVCYFGVGAAGTFGLLLLVKAKAVQRAMTLRTKGKIVDDQKLDFVLLLLASSVLHSYSGIVLKKSRVV